VTLVYVTGISGAGKSTVRDELARRGYLAFDTDEDEVAQWTHKVTGIVTPLVVEAHRTPEFLSENEWRTEPERVRRLAEESTGRTVFLCGHVGNEDDVWSYFDEVVFLSIDQATLKRRLTTRTAHTFGTKPHELELLLAWHTVIDDFSLRRGAIMVDASPATERIVDEILCTLPETSG